MTTDLKTAAQAACDAYELSSTYGRPQHHGALAVRMADLRAALATTPSVAVDAKTGPEAIDISLFDGWTPAQKLGYVESALRWAACGYVHSPERMYTLRVAWKLVSELAASPAAAMPSVAVDAKWRMVPVEPTEEMIREVYLQVPVTGLDDEAIGEIWSAMLDGVVTPQDANAPIYSLLEWACWRWREEVQDRPLGNVHRRTLDDTWRQVIRHSGGDPSVLVGPSHDERPSKEKSND